VFLESAQRIAPADSRPVSKHLWQRIYSRVGSYWKGLAVAAMLMAGAAATQPTLALIMKPLLDGGFSGENPNYFWTIPLIVVSLVFLRGVCNFFSDYLLAWVANNVLQGMRRDMFDRLLGLPDSDFKRGDTGRLLNRFTIDAGNLTSTATEVITVLVRESLIVLALLGVLFYTSWLLTLIVIVMLPVTVLVTRVFIKRLRRISRDTVNMNAELTRVVGEGIDGQRVIKLFDGYEAEQNRFNFVNGRLRRFAMRAATADAALAPLTQLCIAVSVATVIAVALSQANSEMLTVGCFASFMAALAQIPDPIKRLTNVASKMQKMLVAAESVFALIDQPQEPDHGTQSAACTWQSRVSQYRVPFPQRGARHLKKHFIHGKSGANRGPGRPIGQWQDHPGQYVAPLCTGELGRYSCRRRAHSRSKSVQLAFPPFFS
jgi:ATP-binding cassette, subfamily B, bacterial MsbA